MNKIISDGPEGKLVEIEGITYQLIDGRLCRYADLTLDKGFKIVLGCPGSEGVLKNLLNCLLGTKIVDLEYRSQEYPGMTEEDRSSRFDVFCRDVEGNGFLIEMQNWSQKYFNKRAVYYSSVAVQNQAVEEFHRQRDVLGREWDYDFRPLYVVSFLNFKNWTFEGCELRRNCYVATYKYADIETGLELGDGTTLVFVDLSRFTKSLGECDGLEDLWIYCIKNMATQSKCPDMVFGTELEELFTKAELAKMTVEQRSSYQISMMQRNDIRNSMREAIEAAKEEAERIGREKGEAEGREEGKAEGKAEGRVETLREVIDKMSASGMDMDQISSILKMSAEDISALI